MTSASDRITRLVKSTGESMRALSRKMGLNPVSLSQWANGRYKPSEDGLKALCEYFRVTPAWILYGEGDDPQIADNEHASTPRTVQIPLYDADASCGTPPNAFGSGNLICNLEVFPEFARRYAPGANISALEMITCHGDSMTPTIDDGDVVIVDTSQKTVTADGIYAVRTQFGTFVKRIQLTPTGARLISDNRRYDPIDLCEQDSVEIVGKVYAGAFVRSLL